MSIHRDLREAAVRLIGCSNTFAARWQAILDAQAGQPGAQSFEQSRTTGHSTVYDEFGVPMPSVSDPTGEAALLRLDDGDHAAADEKEARRLVHRIGKDVGKLSRLLGDYEGKREAGSIARRQTEAANRKDPGCEHCATVGKWTAPHVDASDAKGNLDRDYRLCVWCWRHVLDSGRLPTTAELESHHAGKKLRRPA